MGLFTWWSDDSWHSKKEKITRIFGWLDTEAIKDLLGGLFPCKAWALIWKITVDSFVVPINIPGNGVRRECKARFIRADSPQILSSSFLHSLMDLQEGYLKKIKQL